MRDKQMVMEFVKDGMFKVDARWTVHWNEGSFDGHDVDETWTREIHEERMDTVEGLYYKESVRFVRYGNLQSPLVNVQYSAFGRDRKEDGWKFLTGHTDGVMPLEEARERYIK